KVLQRTSPIFRSCPLPLGRGWRGAPGEGGPPNDLQRLTESSGGLPSSGATAPPSPEGRRARLQRFLLFRALGLAGRHLHRSAFILQEEHDEFRRFGLACISSNDVNIIRTFIKGLTRRQSRFLSAFHLHHD